MTLIALLALLHAPVSGGDDAWPGWRGTDGSGVASGAPPTEWSEQKNVRWKTALPGKGLSCPVVWGGQVFVSTAIGTGKKAEPAPAEGGEVGGERGGGRGGRGGRGAPIEEQDFVVLALDRKSGAVQWQKKLATAMPHQGTHPDGSYASPTPVTDGKSLFVSFGSFGIHALSLKGEELWSVDLGDMNIDNGFGEGSSPVLFGDTLILTWDHEGDSFLVALDKASGKERWRTARERGTNWATPLLIDVAGAKQLVVAGGLTVAYDPATGKELWRQGEAGRSSPIASPVRIEELVIYASGGRGGGEARALVAQEAKEGESAEPLLWKSKVDGPHVPSPLAWDGKVYLLKQDSGMLSVLDPTSGEVVYGPERLKGVADVYASLVAAGGHLYVAGRDGSVEVLSAWPKVESLAVNRLEDGFDSSPAIAGDELFLRGKANLYCIAK
jgi:outer membrane protein assembly factor BamB